MRMVLDNDYSPFLLKQIKKEDYALTYDMCNKNDYTGCKVRMLVSQEVWYPLAVIIYKETGDKEITIYSFEVHPEHRITNVGRRMLTKFKENANMITLCSLVEAKIFYEKLGFQEQEESRMIWRRKL